MEVGDRIRRIRRQRGMTGAELATASGLSRGYIGDIETGRSNPTLPTLEKIAHALNVPMPELLVKSGSSEITFSVADVQVHLRGAGARELTRYRQESPPTLVVG